MNEILLKNVTLGNEKRNILIGDHRFISLNAAEGADAAEVMDCSSMAVLPAFYNAHCHAAMTLLRGYADDMPLQKWLTEYIFPFEDKLTAGDIREGSRIAVKEMSGSGSVFFNDMYFNIEETIDEVNRSGMRAAIGITVMECHSLATEIEKLDFVKNWRDPSGGRIQLLMAPHAIYTVGEAKLRKTAEFARNNGIRLHIHLSETDFEVGTCLKEHGKTPVEYLDSIGFLGPDVIAAHCVHVNEKDADILAERGVTIAHCPCSNMKLGSGIMPYRTLIKAGCRMTLGTDGASSGNNLDMREAMKFAALLAKVSGSPETLPAQEVLKWATLNGAEAFGIDAGEIKEGKLADCILVDLDNIRMKPCHNLISNWVYAAETDAIKKVICNGKTIA